MPAPSQQLVDRMKAQVRCRATREQLQTFSGLSPEAGAMSGRDCLVCAIFARRGLGFEEHETNLCDFRVGYLIESTDSLEGRCTATWKREFKHPWREAGPATHPNDKVDSDQ